MAKMWSVKWQDEEGSIRHSDFDRYSEAMDYAKRIKHEECLPVYWLRAFDNYSGEALSPAYHP